MKTLMATAAASVLFSAAFFSASAVAHPETSLNDVALAQELASVNKVNTPTDIETHRLDNRKGFIIESGREYYLVTTHRKIRSWDIIKLDRTFSSISKADIQICERNVGCLGAGVKGIYKLGDKQSMQSFKEALVAHES